MNRDFLNKLMDVSGEITMGFFGSDLNVQSKNDDSPVTIADQESERALRDMINQTYPEHGILGEEFGAEKQDAEYVWIIDPIDGTRAFINHIDTFANMVGLLKNGVPIMSAVAFPAKGERYMGIDGKAFLNEQPISASSHDLSACDVCFCGEYMFDKEEWATVQNVIDHAKGTIVGGDAYNYCRMACGDARVMVESDLHPYDYLPLVPIVEGAGAHISDWQGDVLTMHSTMQVIAGGSAYQQVLGIVHQ